MLEQGILFRSTFSLTDKKVLILDTLKASSSLVMLTQKL